MKARFFLTLLFTLLMVGVNSKSSSGDCEVCEEILGRIQKSLTKQELKSHLEVEKKIDEYCLSTTDTYKQLPRELQKACYFIQPIKREVSQPMSSGAPPDRICKRLSKKSTEICGIRKSVPIQKGEMDYTTLRVKQLKKILGDRGVSCNNCLEKSEFVKMCQDTEHMEL